MSKDQEPQKPKPLSPEARDDILRDFSLAQERYGRRDEARRSRLNNAIDGFFTNRASQKSDKPRDR